MSSALQLHDGSEGVFDLSACLCLCGRDVNSQTTGGN